MTLSLEDAMAELDDWFLRAAAAVRRQYALTMDYCDIAQEGAIGAIVAHAEWNGQGEQLGWMREKARWYMRNYVSRGRAHKSMTCEIDYDILEIEKLGARLTPYEDIDDIDLIDASLYTEKIQVDVRTALNDLSPKQREYVDRKYYRLQTQRQINEEMQLANATTAFWYGKSKAREKLARKLGHLKELVSFV